MNRTVITSTAVAAAALVGGAIVQLDYDMTDQAVVGGTAGHLVLTCFSLSLVALAPLLLTLGRMAGSRGAPAAVAAMVALALVSTVSNVRGEDPSFFPLIAAPSNLVWLAGLIVLAVALVRRGVLAIPVAALLPLTWACMIPLAQMSAGFAAAALWLTILAVVHRRPAVAVA